MMCPMRCSWWSSSVSCRVSCPSARARVTPVSSTRHTVSAAKPLQSRDANVVRSVMRRLLVYDGEPTGLARSECMALNVLEEDQAGVSLGCAVCEGPTGGHGREDLIGPTRGTVRPAATSFHIFFDRR